MIAAGDGVADGDGPTPPVREPGRTLLKLKAGDNQFVISLNRLKTIN
jgi:hypothetical protein